MGAAETRLDPCGPGDNGLSLAFHGRGGGVAAGIRGAEMVTWERGMLLT